MLISTSNCLQTVSSRLKSMEERVFVELVVSVTVLDAISLGS